MKPVLEKHLEQHFSKECKRLGILTLKLSVRFSTGWPDRLICSYRGLGLVELKTITGQLSAKQKLIITGLAKFGVSVAILRSKQEITTFLEEYHGRK